PSAACGSSASVTTTGRRPARGGSSCGFAWPWAPDRTAGRGPPDAQWLRERTLLEAVASSLTEFFSPDLMTRRVLAWEKHYPWISKDTLEYFRSRPPLARQDSTQELNCVTTHATTYELQERCVAALIRKTEILWHLLDCLWTASVERGWGPGGARA